VVEKKPRNARKAGLDGPGVATQTLVDDGSGKVNIPETGASLTEILVQSTLQQLVTIWKNADRLVFFLPAALNTVKGLLRQLVNYAQ
jgi:hypothetical protein